MSHTGDTRNGGWGQPAPPKHRPNHILHLLLTVLTLGLWSTVWIVLAARYWGVRDYRNPTEHLGMTRRTSITAVALLALAGAGTATTLNRPEDPVLITATPRAATLPENHNHRVTINVTGSNGSADLTLMIGGETSQYNIAVPMRDADTNRKSPIVKALPTGTLISMSAQKHNAGGTIRCTIKVDGAVISTADANAEYGIAACSGIVS